MLTARQADVQITDELRKMTPTGSQAAACQQLLRRAYVAAQRDIDVDGEPSEVTEALCTAAAMVTEIDDPDHIIMAAAYSLNPWVKR